ncbi:MAG TPA: alpha/beta family hydrolase [Anaerolineaceae bacterium]|jgi:dienelactone hydrolase
MPLGKHLETRGYRGSRLPLSLWEQPQPAETLTVVFPGLGYHTDLPVLYYPALALFGSGADVLRLEFRYNEQPGFSRQTDEELSAWLAADAAAVLDLGLERHAYTRIALIGKSLGTVTMAAILDHIPTLDSAACLWLTPVLTNPAVRQQIDASENPGLVAIGDADPYYDPALVGRLKNKPNLRCLVFPGADHSLEVAGDALADVHIMDHLVQAVIALSRA